MTRQSRQLGNDSRACGAPHDASYQPGSVTDAERRLESLGCPVSLSDDVDEPSRYDDHLLRFSAVEDLLHVLVRERALLSDLV